METPSGSATAASAATRTWSAYEPGALLHATRSPGTKPSTPSPAADTVPAPSLSGNLLGDLESQPAFVYLPPGYEEELDQRFPVLYLLHGVLDSPEVWVEPVYDGMTIQATMDSLIAAGEIGPAIVVMPNGRNAYGGSYYANSAVTGGWADFIARDLVAHITSGKFADEWDAERDAGYPELEALRAKALAPEILQFEEDVRLQLGERAVQ